MSQLEFGLPRGREGFRWTYPPGQNDNSVSPYGFQTLGKDPSEAARPSYCYSHHVCVKFALFQVADFVSRLSLFIY